MVGELTGQWGLNYNMLIFCNIMFPRAFPAFVLQLKTFVTQLKN